MDTTTTMGPVGTDPLAKSNPYRYAAAFGMLRGRVLRLELELKYGSNADIRAEALKLVEESERIQKEIDRKDGD